MVTGLFRHALGYRLGTIANLLAMIWVAQITEKLLRPFLRNAWLRAFGVLLVVLAEHLLFEINNYMADLLALPLLLEATYLAVNHENSRNRRRNLVCVAMLLGMSVAFKLTNAAIALPIVMLCAYRELASARISGQPPRQIGWTTLLCAIAFVVPLLPFSLYLYRETGSPVFPVFNGVFKSPYWPASNIWDPRWGPKGLWEKLLWPILISLWPQRLSELAVYSGRISFGFAAALAGFLISRRDRVLRQLCLLVVVAALLWSGSTGYIRYALYVEVLAAIVVIALAARVAERKPRTGTIVAGLLWVGLFAQACLACYYVSKMEWGGRSIFRTGRAYRYEAGYILHDHSLRSFIDPETLKRLDTVDVWLVSSVKTTGLEVMLRPDAPIISVNTNQFFNSPAGHIRFARAIELAAGKRMYSLALAEDLSTAKADLLSKGLVADAVTPIEVPFYSPFVRIRAFLIELVPETQETASRGEHSGHMLPYSAYRATISATDQPRVLKAGAKQVLHLKVRNAGIGVWKASTAQDWIYSVTLADQWLTADESSVVNNMDSRAVLPRDLKPGEEAEIALTVTAPQTPGEYVLELDMVHEGVTWFYEQGSPTLRWRVKVEQ
jgi:hypothetical protein